jgi:hypothetical protein
MGDNLGYQKAKPTLASGKDVTNHSIYYHSLPFWNQYLVGTELEHYQLNYFLMNNIIYLSKL